MPDEQQAQQEQDDAAVGHTVRLFIRETFKGRQGLIILGLLLGLGGREASRFSWTSDTVKIEKKLDRIGSDLVEVKVTSKAILQTTPKGQRAQAQAIIDSQMEAIRLAEAQRSDK